MPGGSKVDPRHNLSKLSCILHPWRLLDAIRQTSKAVEEQLRAELQAIETLLETNGRSCRSTVLLIQTGSKRGMISPFST